MGLLQPWERLIVSEYDCMMCGADLPNYDPKMCCSGFECGCMGKPTEPPICSQKCWDALMARNQAPSDPTSGDGNG